VFSLIPKEKGTITVGSYIEIARQFWLSTELCGQCDLARHFKTEPIETVVFSFGISENTVFSNVIDSYHLVDERYISRYDIDDGFPALLLLKQD
jgi:hypothetical protein